MMMVFGRKVSGGPSFMIKKTIFEVIDIFPNTPTSSFAEGCVSKRNQASLSFLFVCFQYLSKGPFDVFVVGPCCGHAGS